MNASWKSALGVLVALLAITSFDSRAQNIESLVMPGEVISDHAEWEPECSSCHKRFDRSAQIALCLDCHEDIAADVNQDIGLHGLSPSVDAAICATCHTDHKGRDANIIDLDEETFEHEFTNFELIGAHLDITCVDCHASGEKHREVSSECISCHLEDDVHQQLLGEQCADCHQSTEWTDATFDHDSTGYPLIGKHLETGCLDCHEDETYQNAPNTCFDCHAEDDAHDGRTGNDCGSCHNPTDWHDSSFDHLRDTEFALLGKHATLTCNDCHSDDPFGDTMDTGCVSCHLEDDSHDGHNGTACNDCHSNDSWAEPKFNHDRDTEFELRGSHIDVACVDCHVEPIFEVTLEQTCQSCHLDDEPHSGSLGTVCESCHTEVTWNDPVYFDHEFTAFPLLGQHGNNDCEDCHETKAFGTTETGCNSCHSDDDPHDGNFHDRCSSCHNPVGWDAWSFDHDLQTEFPLAGAHTIVACEDCHRTPLKRMQSMDASCRNCHRSDDIHDGEFGFDCGRCHSADSFKEVRSLQ